MCGIAGIVNWNGKPVDLNVLVKMTSVLKHRGPDDYGYFVNSRTNASHNQKLKSINGAGNVGLGHRRLSIIDLSTGHQPLSNEDGSIWITFNGEIYNFKSIRDRLKRKGHRFATQTDTEVIVHAYEEWGYRCLNYLNGMFAFVIWDQNKKRIFAARDRLGIKPFYYLNDNDKFLFGSEIKTILQYPGVKQDIRIESIRDYFSLMYIPAPFSIYKNIYKLLPGNYLVIENGKVTQQEYWDIDFAKTKNLTEKQWGEEIIESLKNAIDLRMISEVPLGAFLSGGVDSSAVVSLMSELVDNPIKTSSIGFNDDKFDELSYADAIAQRFHTEHHAKRITADAVSILDKLVWFYDEPFGDPSSIPTYFVSQVAREKVTVALSGDGGDENFAGYRRYYFDRLENRLRAKIPKAIRQTVIKSLAGIYPKADWLPQYLRAKTLLTNLSIEPAAGYFNSMSWFQAMPNIFNEESNKQLGGYNSLWLFEQYMAKANTDDCLSAIQYVDFKTYLVDDILTKVDRASMAHALEVRVPLLDHNFIETVAQIPSAMKLKRKQGKHIFKKSLNKYLPHSTLYRKKMGFSIPLENWFRNDLKATFEENVLSSNSFCSAYLNMDLIKEKWGDFQSYHYRSFQELWALLFFEKWGRYWL